MEYPHQTDWHGRLSLGELAEAKMRYLSLFTGKHLLITSMPSAF